MRTLPASLAVLVSALCALSVPAAAQKPPCTQPGVHGRAPHSLFGTLKGSLPTYKIRQVRGPRGLNKGFLMGLSEVHMPAQGLASTNFGVEFSGTSIPQAGEVGERPDDYATTHSNAWCLVANRGSFFFRGGVFDNPHYESSFFRMVCQGPWCPDRYNFAGVPTRQQLPENGLVQTEFLPGRGYPVARYYVPNYAWRMATNWAHQLRTTHAPEKVSVGRAFDMQLWGRIKRERHPDPDNDCDKFLGLFGGGQCPDFRYRRVLQGKMWVRDWADPRIGAYDFSRGQGGAPRDTAASVLVELNVRMTSVIYEKDWDFMDKIERVVRSYCGTTKGCGSLPKLSPPAEWQLIPGSDDKKTQKALCEQAARHRQYLEKFCSEESMERETTPTQAAVEAVMDSTLAESEFPTAEEKRQMRTGQSKNELLEVPSQAERMCRRLFAKDSVRQVNGPIPVGQDRSDITYEPTDRIPDVCFRYRESDSK